MIRHFTASGIVLDGDRVLLVHHGKLGWWLYPGGHVDPDEDPEQAVRREIREEVGLEVEIITRRVPTYPGVRTVPPPFAILVQDLEDARVGPHQHIDMVYVCRPQAGRVALQIEEVSDHAWVPVAEVSALNTPVDLPELIRDALQFAKTVEEARLLDSEPVR